jgi:hypothetical protein
MKTTDFLHIVESVLIEEKKKKPKKTKKKSKKSKKTKNSKIGFYGGFPLVAAGYWGTPLLSDMSAGGGGDGT